MRSIKEIQNFGKLVILDDGSKWEINFVDSIRTMLWLPFDRIEESLGKLTNLRNNQSVVARRKL